MKPDDILDAIGEIDEATIAEADRLAAPRRAPSWMWAAAAAACVAVGAAAFVLGGISGKSAADGAMSAEAPMAEYSSGFSTEAAAPEEPVPEPAPSAEEEVGTDGDTVSGTYFGDDAGVEYDDDALDYDVGDTVAATEGHAADEDALDSYAVEEEAVEEEAAVADEEVAEEEFVDEELDEAFFQEEILEEDILEENPDTASGNSSTSSGSEMPTVYYGGVTYVLATDEAPVKGELLGKVEDDVTSTILRSGDGIYEWKGYDPTERICGMIGELLLGFEVVEQ